MQIHVEREAITWYDKKKDDERSTAHRWPYELPDHAAPATQRLETRRRVGAGMTQQARTIRILPLTDHATDRDLPTTTQAERLAVMWQLTLDAWAFTGAPDAQSRLQRHVVRLVRRGG